MGWSGITLTNPKVKSIIDFVFEKRISVSISSLKLMYSAENLLSSASIGYNLPLQS